MRTKWFHILYSILLLAFSAYVMLDSFAIPIVMRPVETPRTHPGTVLQGRSELIDFSEKTFYGEYEVIGQYRDENCAIILRQYREYNSDIYVAEISLADVSYLQTAFAKDAYGKNITEKTSVIAERAGAILAVNGDFYGVQETGYVLRNGVIYRSEGNDRSRDLVVYYDGSMEMIDESKITLEELLEAGATQVLSFGPRLVQNGMLMKFNQNEKNISTAEKRHPRTAIGYIDKLHYVFVVADGRREESAGLMLVELEQFMRNLGCVNAYNLDGGGSSSMYFDGRVINYPTDGKIDEERSVSDIVLIKSP